MRYLKSAALFLFLTLGLSLFSQDYQLNGNLGVGTDPNAKLDVDGDTKLRGDTEVDGDTKLHGDTEVDGELKLSGIQTDGTLLDQLLFVDSEGNVKRLGGDYNFLSEIYGRECQPATGSNLATWSASIESMRLCEGFKLGVGFTDTEPSATIHSAGTFQADGQSLLRGAVTIGNTSLNQNWYDARLSIKVTNGLSDFLTAYGPDDTTPFRLRHDGSYVSNLSEDSPSAFEVLKDGDEIFRLDADGSYSSTLGSGATRGISINALLNGDVEEVFVVKPNGNVLATKVTVESAPFPDYVFEDDYALMSLHDLKKYIEINKHLPGMPTAKNVEQNGIDLGENNRILVEKVEELTLYVIQLQERLEKLENDADNK